MSGNFIRMKCIIWVEKFEYGSGVVYRSVFDSHRLLCDPEELRQMVADDSFDWSWWDADESLGKNEDLFITVQYYTLAPGSHEEVDELVAEFSAWQSVICTVDTVDLDALFGELDALC